MLIPLDLYRMLGVPQQTSEELIEQAYQDRIAQLPRQEFSDGAIAVRNALLTIAYDVLRDPAQRHAYDQQWWGDPAPAADALPFSQPEFDCADAQLIGVLLILLDLGEYELVLKYGEPMVDPPTAVTDEADEVVDRADYLLSVTLAHWELSREYWQQQHYDLAAIASLKALARLQPENAFPDLQTTIRQDLYKLRPYRILALVTQSPGPPDAPPPPGERADDPQQNRQQGLDLLQAMIEDRGGIEGKGQDYSGLANDDFLKFILQLRPYLSIEEQAAIFLPESQRPSPVATYLAVHTLIARGIHRQAPDAIREAKLLILQSANCPDLTIENGVCRLLLGQTENLPPVGDMVQAVEAIAPTTANAVVSGDRQQDDDAVLVRFYQFTATWLTREI
ncbi:MAG: Cell division protein Ftn2, contains DnaJ domain, partial [Cyanobacteriota bacterium]